MKIETLSQEKFADFVAFTKTAYPNRLDCEERFQFQVLANPFHANGKNCQVLVALSEAGDIVGQTVLMPTEYCLNGTQHPCYFGCDNYVAEQYRSSGTGFFITAHAIRQYRPHFTIDVTDLSEKLYKSLRAKTIGQLVKYMWLRHSGSFVKLTASVFGGEHGVQTQVDSITFPETVITNKKVFRRTLTLDEWPYLPSNESVLEFTRSAAFVKWRFLQKPDRYAVYRLEDCDCFSYFVVRQSSWRGLDLLALIDYRVPLFNRKSMQLVIRAVKKLVQEQSMDGVITVSSHVAIDAQLQRALFFKVGKPALILTNAPLELSDDSIGARRCVLATMTDSDMELNFK